MIVAIMAEGALPRHLSLEYVRVDRQRPPSDGVPAQFPREVRREARARRVQIAAADVDERARALGRVSGRPQRADRSAAGQQPERRDVGDDRHRAARARLHQRVAAPLVMAADDEEIGGAVEGRACDRAARRRPAARDRPARADRCTRCAHRRQQIVLAVDHRQRRARQIGQRALEPLEDGQRILVRVEAADPEDRRRSAQAGRLPRGGARRRAAASSSPASRGTSADRGAMKPARRHDVGMLVGGEEKRVDGASRRRGRAAATAARGRSRRRRAWLCTTTAHEASSARRSRQVRSGKVEAVDVGDVGAARRDGRGHSRPAKDIVDAVSGDPGVPVKPLNRW